MNKREAQLGTEPGSLKRTAGSSKRLISGGPAGEGMDRSARARAANREVRKDENV